MRGFRLFLGAALVVCAMPLTAAVQPSPEAAAFFENQVRLLLAKTCFKCHGSKKQEAALRLDSRESVLKGGDRGPAVVPGNLEQSLLLQVVGQQGEVKMPPDGKLKDEQIAVLARWVKMGAP